jgi:DNA polymerase III alpha subunit
MNCGRGLPRISKEQLAKHSDGIVVLSGCPGGEIPSLIARGKIDEAMAVCKHFLEIFGDDFFLELWDHNITQESILCKRLYEISSRLSIPWVVTNNVHYAYPEKRIIHDVLTCLRHELTLSTAGRCLRPNGSWYMKSPLELLQQWQHHPEGIKNTLAVAERCEFRLGLLKPELPRIDLSKAQQYLANLSTRHIRGNPDPHLGSHYPVSEELAAEVNEITSLTLYKSDSRVPVSIDGDVPFVPINVGSAYKSFETDAAALPSSSTPFNIQGTAQRSASAQANDLLLPERIAYCKS